MTISTQHPRAELVFELVAFPLVISIRQDNRVTIVMLLLLLLLSAMWRQRSPDRLNLVPAALFMMCVALVFWQGPFIIAGMYLIGALLLINTARAVTRASAYASLLAGLSLYLFGNVAGWLVGFKSGSSRVRIGGYETSDTLFGSRRVFFPFAISINESAFVAAALIAAVVAMITLRQRPRWYLWVGVASGLVVILASNSRMPILLAVPVIGCILLAPRLTRRAAPFAVGVAMMLPFLMTQVQPILGWVAGFIASSQYLSRTQNFQEILGLSSRGDIWSRSIEFWEAHVTDAGHQLFGYGYAGHASSGALAAYDTGSGGYFTNRSALSMHNSLLQTLFDAGLVGATILFGVTIFTVYRYGRNPLLLPMLAVVLILGLSAMTEAVLAPGFGNTPSFLLLYAIVFIPIRAVSRRGVPAESVTGRRALIHGE